MWRPVQVRLADFLATTLTILLTGIRALLVSSADLPSSQSIPLLLIPKSAKWIMLDFFSFFPPLSPFLFQQWYSSSMKVICVWLADRLDLQLHIYQLKTLIRIVKVNILECVCTAILQMYNLSLFMIKWYTMVTCIIDQEHLQLYF